MTSVLLGVVIIEGANSKSSMMIALLSNRILFEIRKGDTLLRNIFFVFKVDLFELNYLHNFWYPKYTNRHWMDKNSMFFLLNDEQKMRLDYSAISQTSRLVIFLQPWNILKTHLKILTKNFTMKIIFYLSVSFMVSKLVCLFHITLLKSSSFVSAYLFLKVKIFKKPRLIYIKLASEISPTHNKSLACESAIKY